MTETPSYPELINLASRLEGKDRKTAETALYCLNRLEKKETKLFYEVQRLRADNEWLIHTANRLVEALRPFMSGLKGQYPSFTDELPIFAGASADDLQFVLKIGNFRLAHYLVEEFDKKNYSKELPILMEYEEKLSRLRAELKNENERVARLFTQIEQLQKALDIAISASAAAIRGNGDD